MITLEITTMERVYYPRDNPVGTLVKVFQGEECYYATRIQADEEGKKYIEVPMKKTVEVSGVTDTKEVAVYEGEKLLLRREMK